MAQRLLGIDVGSYSIKAVEIVATFRSYKVVAFHERRIHGGASEDTAAALRALVAQEKLHADLVITGVRGEAASTRRLSFPFTDPKKIDAALPFQLEEIVPFDLDEIVFDHFGVGHHQGGGADAFAVAVSKKTMEDLLRPMSGSPIDPRIVTLAPLAHLSLLSQVVATSDEPLAVVDMGHRTTDIVIVENGSLVGLRTLARGGAQVTQAIARALNLDGEAAGALKHESLSLEPGEVRSETEALLGEAAMRAISPLVADLRRTFVAHRAGGNRPVERILLCGGGARTRGLSRLVESETGIPVESLRPIVGGEAEIANAEAVADIAPKALGLALRGVTGGKVAPINLRKGSFAVMANLDIIKQRRVSIALSLMALLGLLIFSFVSRGSLLSAYEKSQIEDLRRVTKTIFGKELSEFTVALNQIQPAEVEEQRIPEVTAFDYWGEFARFARARQSSKIAVKMDVLSFAVNPRSIDVRGEIDSQEQLAEVEQNLKSNKCFTKVTIPESRKSAISDRIQFRISIEPGC